MKSKIFKKLLSAFLSVAITSQFSLSVLPESVFADRLNTDYILYSDKNITVNMDSAVFNGNVFTDNSFDYLGKKICYVNETLNADKINGNIKAADKVEAKSKKPDYTSQLDNGVHYKNVYTNDTTLDMEKYDLSDSVYSKGKLWIDRVSFSGKGYVRAKGNIQYDAVANDENSEIFLYSSNGNITVQGTDLTLDGVLYAPNGKVEINAKNLHLRGTIVAESVELNGTDLTFDKINNSESELLQFNPEINFGSSDDTFRQNRKITLDISESYGLKDIDEDSIEWSFTADDPANADAIKVDEENSTKLQKNLIITEVGTYRVTLTAKDKKGNSVKYYEVVNIVEDIAPVAAFWKNVDVSGRDENGKARIELEDTSYSLDGDPIESRIWSAFFDSDNDGDFSDENEEVFSIGNEKNVTFTADSVGKYMFRLVVAENIHDTIPSLISENAYRTSDSTSDASLNSVVEVTNEAPESYSGINKARNVDIVVTVGSADLDDIQVLNNNVDGIKKELEDKGYSVNLSTVTTSTLTARDTFAWDEYDHYNYADWYNQTLEKHIVYDKDSIRMLGYFWEPLRDWLFVDDGIKAKRILSFDMVRDQTDWHSMEGGGFLFNTTIREEKVESDDSQAEPKIIKKIDGYCVLLTSGGFKLIELKDLDVDFFRNGRCASVQSAGKVLASASAGNVYDNYNVKIIASDRLVSVYANDNCIIENFVLPDPDTGTGFGPITSHVSHGCSQQSYFTFSNIKMSTINGSELSDVLDKSEWRDSADHYVINLSKNKLADLNDNASVGSAVKSLIENGAEFISLGTADSKPQYDMVLRSTEGVYADWYDLIKEKNIIKNYILNDLSGKKYNVENNTITTSDDIEYNNYFVDKENDPVSDQIWTYDLDSSVYENSSGKSGTFTSDKPLAKLESTGKYNITSRLRDDPTKGNSSLEDYKKWSNEVNWINDLYVHSKPVAEIKAETKATDDPNKFICNLYFNAFDNDALSHASKGIKTEKFEWKCVDDSQWHDGKIPQIITAEEIYLQKYSVCDEMDVWSQPCVELVYAEKQGNSEMFVDNEPPEVEITVSDENPCVDDQIAISVSAKDNTEIAYTKLMVNGKVISQYQGTIIYDCKKEEELKITAETSDIAKNISTTEKIITVTDRRDLIAPEININTSKNVAFKDGTLTITGSVTDNIKLDNYKVSYAVDGTDKYQEVLESADEVNDDVIASFDLPDGSAKYNVRITAEDAAHNTAYVTIKITVTGSDASASNSGKTSHVVKPEKRTDTAADITLDASADKVEIGEMVTVNTDASDVDGLKSFKVYLDNKLISENPGQLRFTQNEAKVSTIRIDTTDVLGGKTTKSIEVVFEDTSDKTPPAAVIITPEKGQTVSGKVSIVGSVSDETRLRGYTLEYKKTGTNSYTKIISSLNEIDNKELGVWDTDQLQNGEYEVKLTATDNGGNIAYASCNYIVANGKTPTADEIAQNLIEFRRPQSDVSADDVLRIEADADPSLGGGEYQVYIEKKNTDSGRIIVQSGTIPGSGVTADVDTSFYDDGQYTVGVVVQKGETIAQNEVTAVISHGNKTPDSEYICKIVSPEAMSEITSVSEIKAQVSSNIFNKFKMEYSPAGKNNYVVFDSGSIDKDDIVCKLDPTMLENGLYDIRFTAFGDGKAASDIITVSIDGEMKIGNFTLSFSDLTIKAGCVPVSAIRTYDSRRKDLQGSFGFGWDMTFDNVKLTLSGDQSKNWEQTSSTDWFISTYSISEKVKHKIKIDLGNGTSEEFRMSVSPQKQVFYPIMYGVSVEYVSLSGYGSTLVPCTSASDLIYNADVLYTSDLEKYDPQEFIYTRSDGTKYRISVSEGLKSVTTADGNVISFNKNGISSADEKLISYTYDSDGRITHIESKTGEKVSYQYDAFGNLIAVTDVSGDKISFKYDKRHYLTEILNADGKLVSKNEYDNDGRLVKTTDGAGNAVEYSHDIDGREEIITDRNGGVTKYIYDEKGNVISTTDPMGNTVKNSYDSNGNIASKTDALGNITTYVCDADGKISSLTDALGHTVKNEYSTKGYLTTVNAMGVDVMKITYDDKGNPTSTVDALGNSIDYDYDNTGNLSSVTDEIGTYMLMTYDSNGNAVSATNGEGSKSEFTYDEKGNCTSKTISFTMNGEVKTVTEKYEYDAAGNLIKTIDSDGNVTSSEYNEMGKISAEIDAQGRRTTYSYDVLGNLTGIKYADGTTESFTYDREGNNLTATDRLGRTVTMAYDKAGNLVSKTYPNNTKTAYEYDANYNLISTTDVNGNVTSYSYDSLGRNTSITDALGNTVSFTYNDKSQLSAMTDALGNITAYVYDDNGNRIETVFADGSNIKSSYDARGRVTSQTDQNGNVTEYTYDGADHLTGVKDALGNVTSYGYNEVGNLVSVTDANKNTTKYTYDDFSRVIRTTNALGQTAEASYDVCGNVLTQIDFGGNLTNYAYDKNGRVSIITTGEDTIRYNYTNDGKLSTVQNADGVNRFTYDDMDGLTKIVYSNGNYVEYAYDQSGRLTDIKTAFGTTSYEYDKLNRVSRVVDKNGYATVYTYDKNGNRSEVKYANGITVSYEYDEVNRLISEKALDKQGGIVAQYDYTLGAAGERTSVKELDRTVEYTYDALYRLTGEKITAGSSVTEYTYTYDSVSNRLTKTEDGTKTDYTYNELNQLVKENDTVYTYDDAGNLISVASADNSSAYTYNSENKLIRATVQEGNNVSVEEYEYDFAGNRTVKKSENDYTYYLNDISGSLTQVLAELDKDGNAKCWYTRGIELISQQRETEISSYITDGHGSVRLLTDMSGAVTDTYTFDAWGKLISSTGDTENSYLYCGEQLDSTTGLYYLRARYMNPSTGTFISMDTYQGSVFDPVSLHKYLYANANPVMNTEPTGYFSLADISVSNAISNILDNSSSLNYIRIYNKLKKALDTINNVLTLIDLGRQIFAIITDPDMSALDMIANIACGVITSMFINHMCQMKAIGPIISKVLIGYGLATEFDQIIDCAKNKDWYGVAKGSIQLLISLMSLSQNCFTGDTLIATEDGQVRIDEIKVGDKVWAYDIYTGQTELKEVTKVYVHEVDEILHVNTTEGEIDTTTNHPFYVIGEGWVAAGDLTVGDEIISLDGSVAVIAGSETQKLDESILVYNLEVADYNTYFVGDVPVLVHNYNGSKDNNVSNNNNESNNNKDAYIKHDTYNEIRNRFGKKGVDKFITAMKKGIVGSEGESGIKWIGGANVNGKSVSYEIKLKCKEFGNWRVFGNYDEETGHIIFDIFGTGLGHH